MRCVKGISIVLMLALAPAASAEEGGTDTPEQSLRKSEVHAESKRATTGFADFAAGILRVTTPADDLDEPLPTGTKTDFERRGYIVVSDNRVEILVDRAGQIYKDRIYQGIIPGLRNTLRAGELDELQGMCHEGEGSLVHMCAHGLRCPSDGGPEKRPPPTCGARPW